MKNTFKLCLVTHPGSMAFPDYITFLSQVLEGGVTLIQLRDKSRQLNLKQTRIIQELVKSWNIPFIINDDVLLAKNIDADGVHLGQSDISPLEARKILGPYKILGWSLETEADLDTAHQLDCFDYVAVSAVFPSSTKLDCKTIWGLDGLQRIISRSKYPVVAIGGINESNAASVMQQGACGIAVVSALHQHPDPKEGAAALVRLL